MSKTITLPDVPDELHAALVADAAREGMSVADYLLRLARVKTERGRSNEALFKRLASRPVRHMSPTPTEMIREERDRRSGE